MFTPNAARAADILEELARPSSSLENVAIDHETTVDDLTLWLVTPQARASMERMTEAVVLHLRLVTMSALPAVVGTLADQLIAYEDDEKTYPINRSTHPHAQETRRSNARRACSLLFRIARFVSPEPHSPPRRPRKPVLELSVPTSPSPREGAGGWAAVNETPPESPASTPKAHDTPPPISPSAPISPSPREGAGGWATVHETPPESRTPTPTAHKPESTTPTTTTQQTAPRTPDPTLRPAPHRSTARSRTPPKPVPL